jgi:hypothetical protein
MGYVILSSHWAPLPNNGRGMDKGLRKEERDSDPSKEAYTDRFRTDLST